MGKDKKHVTILEFLEPHLHLALMRTLFTSIEHRSDISARERELLRWMKEGKTNWEIGRITDISERTVKFHLQNIFRKLNASSRTQAVAIAMEKRLISQ